MSIPGLGQIAPPAIPTTTNSALGGSAGTSPANTTSQALEPFWEYRFEVPHSSSITIKLVSGTAEKDGTELAPNTPYTFTATKSKINTWHGCTLEISSPSSGGGGGSTFDAYTSEPTADETPMVSYLNLHFKLEGLRAAAQRTGQMGPRILVVGPSNAGKTSLVRTLTAWATRMARQPLVVNTDCREGMLALPGTLSAAVFATIMDVTTDWGQTPSSGPSAIPVKLPLAYYYGLAQPEDNMKFYKRLLSRLAVAATSRLSEDPEVRASGMLIDTGGVNANAAKGGYDYLAHVVGEFSVNIVIVLGSERISSELAKKLAGQKTSLGEPVTVVGLDKSGGVVERDAGFMQHVREAAIREYFFGDANTTLGPFTQQVDFSSLSVWRINGDSTISNDEDHYGNHSAATLDKAEPSMMMQNCVLAVMYASIHDGADALRDANVMGFVYVADIDEKRKKLKVLAPVGARLGDRPLLWGSWPEPMVSLLG